MNEDFSVNLFGRLVLPRLARPDRVAAVRRLLANHPRLFAHIRSAAFWLSTVGQSHHKVIFRTRGSGAQARSRTSAGRGNQFEVLLALNERAAEHIASESALERLMRDVFASTPNVQFPVGAQATFALLKRGHSIAAAIEAARSRGVPDAEISVGVHAYFLRSLPDPGQQVDGLDPFLVATRILNRRDFIARRNGALSSMSGT